MTPATFGRLRRRTEARTKLKPGVREGFEVDGDDASRGRQVTAAGNTKKADAKTKQLPPGCASLPLRQLLRYLPFFSFYLFAST